MGKQHGTQRAKDSRTSCHAQEDCAWGGQGGRGRAGRVQTMEGLRFGEVDIHPLLSTSRWVPVQNVKAVGRNGQVGLAAMWRPQLLLLATCPFRWKKKSFQALTPSDPLVPPGKRWPCPILHPLPFPGPGTIFVLSILTNTLHMFLQRHLICLSLR